MAVESTLALGQGDQDQFGETPQGLQAKWMVEFAAAKKNLEKWHDQGEKIINRFLDKRDSRNEGDTRLNLFTANVQTLRALLYGKTPTVDVQRRFGDSRDDQARVASEMLERMLNSDIERDDDSYATALQYALDDRLLAGLGTVRVRYEVEWEKVPEQPAILHPETGLELAPAVPETEKKADEDVETDYVHWRDQLWSPARTFHEVRWWAFLAQMSRKQLVERFGEDLGGRVPMNSKRAKRTDDSDAKKNDPWSRADVWEVWSKEERKVYWVVEGMDRILDEKDDPLGLDGFWPFARPLVANLTTSGFIPRPDFVIAQDLYDEIDMVSTRITLLERAVAVRGVYDKTNEGLKRLVSETTQNELIPVDSWGSFAEKGGLKGVVDFLPLDMIVGALDTLRGYRQELIGQLYQVTGMSDIMRGQASQQTTATEQAIKAKFASVRVQSFQDEFARFASDVQAIKAEIIAKHFDPQTIIARSNVERTPDAPFAAQAVQLIKDQHSCYRIQVKPESVSLADYAANKQEATERLQAVGGFLQVMGPLAMQMPGFGPFMLQILSAELSKMKGGNDFEAIFDQAIAQMQQAAAQPKPPPPPDPKVQATQMKVQGDLAKTQLGHQADMQRIQAETQAAVTTQAAQAHFNVKEEEAKQRLVGMNALNNTLPGRPS